MSGRERSVIDSVAVFAEVDRTALGRTGRDSINRARGLLEVIARIGLDINHVRGAAGAGIAVITERRMDNRDREVLHLGLSEIMGREARGGIHLEAGVAHFGEIGPSVLVRIGVGVVTRAVITVHVFDVIFHEVVVGVELAEIHGPAFGVGRLQEVVGLDLSDERASKRRIQHVEGILLDAVLLVIGEAVVVGVGLRVGDRAGVDSVHILPPVGHAVVVEVTGVAVIERAVSAVMVLAVGQKTERKIAEVRTPRRHLEPVIDNGCIPHEVIPRTKICGEVLTGVLFPPIRKPVMIAVHDGFGPSISGTKVIPHAALGRGNALGVDAAERNEVITLGVGLAHRELIEIALVSRVVLTVDRTVGTDVELLIPAALRLGRTGEIVVRKPVRGGGNASREIL